VLQRLGLGERAPELDGADGEAGRGAFCTGRGGRRECGRDQEG